MKAPQDPLSTHSGVCVGRPESRNDGETDRLRNVDVAVAGAAPCPVASHTGLSAADDGLQQCGSCLLRRLTDDGLTDY
jgi:hypothetical protein